MHKAKATALFLLLGTTSHLSAQTLRAYWPFEQELTDQATDGSNADDATWVGTPSFTGTSPFGDAILLDGNNFLTVPGSLDLNTGTTSLTLSGWYRIDQLDRPTQVIFAKADAPNYAVQLQNGASIELEYLDGASDPRAPIVSDGQWHHFATVSTPGENAQIFIDGQFVAESGTSSINDTGGILGIGNDPDNPTRGWEGGLDELGIFQEPLSAAQIAAIYQLGSNEDFEYRLPEVLELSDRFAEGPSGDPILIDNDTWIYVPSDPGGDSTFIVFGNDGSGMQLSPGPEVREFIAIPNFISAGSTTALQWELDGSFTNVEISPLIGDVTSQTNSLGIGSVAVNPTETTNYTISATNAEGTNIARVTVFVELDPTAVRINEFVARPANDGEQDENGDTQDWIELFNPGDSPVDLGTYYLTDDPDDLRRWAIPSVIIQPGIRARIFASGNDLRDDPGFFHTNFSLSGSGEFLALTRDTPDGGVEIVNQFTPEYPEQFEGSSYGFNTSGSVQGYFATPTPGTPNGIPTNGFVQDTNFSETRGFFTSPFDLTISTDTPDATIRFTINGTAPSETEGTIYTGPITISETTVLRAIALRPGFQPTNVDTQTYLFLDDVATQNSNGAAPSGWPSNSVNGQVFNYGMDPEIVNDVGQQAIEEALAAIPSVSLVMNQSELTSSSGIYTNAMLRGRAWERAASIELIDPNDGPEEFQIDCGVRIRGGFSRSDNNPKHAFRFFFRNEYGASKLDYPLFGTEGAEEFDRFDLRTAQNYSWSFTNRNDAVFNTFLREVLGRDLQGQFGDPHTRSRYYHLYVNGIYWGLFMSQERAGADYGETYLGGDDNDFDTLKSSGNTGNSTRYDTEATDGTFVQGTASAPGSDWARLFFLTQNQENLAESAREDAYLRMQGLNPDGSRNPDFPVLLDADNLILYQMIIGYTGNYDAPLSAFIGSANNWFAIRDRETDDRGFSFFVHDGEHSMGAGGRWASNNDRINTLNGSGDRNRYVKYNPGFVHLDLADTTSSYRRRFGDIAHALLFNDGALTAGSILDTISERESIVEQVIDAEAARWGDSRNNPPLDRSDWENAVTVMKSIVDNRTEVFLGHLREGNLYPDVDAPVFSTNQRRVNPAQPIFLRSDDTLIYFTNDGTDPRASNNAPSANATLVNGGGIPSVFLSENSSWEFLDTGDTSFSASDVVVGHPDYNSSDWKHPLFPTPDWETGNGPFRFGSVTNISGGTALSDNNQITTYFRTEVEVSDVNLIRSITADYVVDDGFILYVNGREALRETFAEGALVTSLTTATGGATEGTRFSEIIDPSLFHNGTNVLALELHNANANSNDLGISFEISVALEDPVNQIFITEPQEIFSRAFDPESGEWSALNAGVFTPGIPPNSSNLIITEVNYRPASLASPLTSAASPSWKA